MPSIFTTSIHPQFATAFCFSLFLNIFGPPFRNYLLAFSVMKINKVSSKIKASLSTLTLRFASIHSQIWLYFWLVWNEQTPIFLVWTRLVIGRTENACDPGWVRYTVNVNTTDLLLRRRHLTDWGVSVW